MSGSQIRTVCVAGSGTMGRGIAQAFAERGFQVVLYNRPEDGVLEGYQYIEDILASFVKKGTLTEAERLEILSRITATTQLLDASGADLVVESVMEDLAIKREMFRKLEAVCRSDTLFVSNTSSISVSAIAAALRRPERFCGMHFFYPPAKMPVVEISVARQSSPQTVAAVKRISEELGKTPIEVRESPGFVFNRLMIPMINEAAFLLMEGVSSREEIDAMMRLAASHPIGPLELGDIIGLDICLNILEVLHSEFGDDKYRPCPLIRRMVYANELGRKTGKGFYEYPSH